jgi:transposase
MDVHKDSITIAVLPADAKTPTRLERLANDRVKVKRFLDRLAGDGDLRSCYEASGAGDVLHRALRDWGYACDVIAPSLIPKRPGVQRKHAKQTSAMRASSPASIAPGSSRRCGFRVKPKSVCATWSGVARHFSERS